MFNRKLAGFQYYKLTQYIKYKAALAGITVISVSEANTSQYCRKCYQKGVRKIQGLFECCHCSIKENADRNAAFNIYYWEPCLSVTVNIPNSKTLGSIERNTMITREATELVRW
jgi:transposase